MKTVEVSLNEEELELIECAMMALKTKWLKESSKAIKGKSDLSFEACLRRIGQIDSLDVHLAVAKGFAK